MKKALKITGKIIKWYAKLTVYVLAFIGTGQLLKEARKHPEKGVLEVDSDVIEKTVNQYKKYFKC